MTEKDIRHRLKALAPDQLLIVPVETGTIPGFPDLYFACGDTSGLIELKIAEGKRKIRIPYRPGQRRFLIEHAKYNSRTYTLIYFAGTYYLVGPNHGFPDHYGSEAELRRRCQWFGNAFTPDFLELLVRETTVY